MIKFKHRLEAQEFLKPYLGASHTAHDIDIPETAEKAKIVEGDHGFVAVRWPVFDRAYRAETKNVSAKELLDFISTNEVIICDNKDKRLVGFCSYDHKKETSDVRVISSLELVQSEPDVIKAILNRRKEFKDRDQWLENRANFRKFLG